MPSPIRPFAAFLALAVAVAVPSGVLAQASGSQSRSEIAAAKAALPPTAAKVLFGDQNGPAPLTARSIGAYSRGCLAGAVALPVDARDANAIEAAFKRVDSDGYAADLVVHNVGTNRPRKFLDLTPEHLERSWEADCLSGFLVAQGALARMLPRGRGTLLFTGASASLRGKAGFGGFAATKAGLRMLAQSLAREFGPQGVHVAHIVVDGMVDGQRLRDALPGLLEHAGDDAALDPAAIADTYWQLYQQPRSTWTHELDLRPAQEAW